MIDPMKEAESALKDWVPPTKEEICSTRGKMTAEQLLKSLSEPIAVVGNGMMRNQGAEIDSFATVIRFNNYILAPEFDIHIGKRTDVWCINCNWQDVKRRDWNGPMLTTSMLSENADVAKWLERYPQLAVPENSWIEMANEWVKGSPSTGIALANRLCESWGTSFSVFGFDGFRSGHYWEPLHVHTHADEFPAVIRLAEEINFR